MCCCAGLVLAPMDFAPEEVQGLPYVPSFALGVLMTAPVLTGILMACRQAPPRLYVRAAGIWGTLAGVIWNAGNVGLSSNITMMCSGPVFAIAGRYPLSVSKVVQWKVTVTASYGAGLLHSCYDQPSSGLICGVPHHAGKSSSKQDVLCSKGFLAWHTT